MYIDAQAAFDFHSCTLPSVSSPMSVYIRACHVTITLDQYCRHPRLPGVGGAAREVHGMDTRGSCICTRASHHCWLCQCLITHVADRHVIVVYSGCTDADAYVKVNTYMHSEELEKSLMETTRGRSSTDQLQARATAALSATPSVPPEVSATPLVRAIDTCIMPSVHLHVISYPSSIHYMMCVRYECVHPTISWLYECRLSCTPLRHSGP